MARKIVVGIDVGTSLVRVVVAECFPGVEIPRIIGTGVAESRGLRHGYIIQPEEATKSIEKAIKENEGIQQSTLRYKTGMSKTSLSLLLKQFETKGIITKESYKKTNKIHLRKKF